MINKEKLDRINYLVRKSKTEGLSLEEKIEQKNLREEYLSNFRKDFRTRLENIVFVDENGNELTRQKNIQ